MYLKELKKKNELYLFLFIHADTSSAIIEWITSNTVFDPNEIEIGLGERDLSKNMYRNQTICSRLMRGQT